MIPENIRAHRRTAFQNSEGMGGSLNWNSEGMWGGGFFELEFRRYGGGGGFFELEFRGHGGFQIWDFQRGQTRVCSLKRLILWTLLVRK